ncbi:MAG TPA: hypothetical protein VF892_20740 [Pseudonocardiaceae bacterium]
MSQATIRRAAFSPDGHLVAATSDSDDTARIWDPHPPTQPDAHSTAPYGGTDGPQG